MVDQDRTEGSSLPALSPPLILQLIEHQGNFYSCLPTPIRYKRAMRTATPWVT